MAVPSFTSELLDSGKVTPETEYNIKWSAASLYSGTPLPRSNLIKYTTCSRSAFVVRLSRFSCL